VWSAPLLTTGFWLKSRVRDLNKLRGLRAHQVRRFIWRTGSLILDFEIMALKFFDAEPFDFSLAGRQLLLREIRPSGMNSKFPAGAENGHIDAVHST